MDCIDTSVSFFLHCGDLFSQPFPLPSFKITKKKKKKDARCLKRCLKFACLNSPQRGENRRSKAASAWSFPVCLLMWSLICDPQKYVTFQQGYLMFPWLWSARLHCVLSFAALFLLNVENPVAARAGVVRILEVVHEERDEAAAQHQPAAQQRTFEQTSQTGGFPCSTWHERDCGKAPAASARHPPAADEE